jgi:hypothetical protein
MLLTESYEQKLNQYIFKNEIRSIKIIHVFVEV